MTYLPISSLIDIKHKPVIGDLIYGNDLYYAQITRVGESVVEFTVIGPIASVDALNERIDNIIAGTVEGVSAAEIVDARDSEATLGANITKVKSQLEFEILTTKKLINEAEKNSYHNKVYTNDFANIVTLNDWDTTKGFVISDGNLTIDNTADQPAHKQVALFDTVDSAKTIEVTLDSNPTRFRIVFAKDKDNFVYVSRSSNTVINIYRMVSGTLITSYFSASFASHTFASNDRLRVVLYNQNLQFYINDVLVTTFALSSSSQYLFTETIKPKAGIAIRDFANAYSVSKVKVSPKPHKYMHFSVDDTLGILKDLATNSSTYNSIFDNVKLDFVKSLYDKYGAVFSFYCFYTDGTWDLSQMPTKFSNEFRENSSWLKFGFHGLDSSSNYSDGSTTVVDALTQYNNITNEIIRFSHYSCLDVVPRTSRYSGTIEFCRALRDADVPIRGFLTSDDSREVDLYLDSVQKSAVLQCDDFLDLIENLYFVRTDIRLENVSGDITTLLDSRLIDYNYVGQNDIMEIFTHEGNMGGSALKRNMENACIWAINHGYSFDFPMNNIPKY